MSGESGRFPNRSGKFRVMRFVLVNVIKKKNIAFPISRFTSMFVERMEVLEYRHEFEVELSLFPDSTNTKTSRKLVFSSTCVSVRKCLSVDILRTS